MSDVDAAREALLIHRVNWVGGVARETPTFDAAVDALIAAVRAEGSRVYGAGMESMLERERESAQELAALRKVVEKARIVSQWHGAIGSGPIEELDAELGELGVLARAALAEERT